MGISDAPTLAELQKLSDAEIIKLHDSMAENTVVGVQYYLDEINRRSQAKLSKKIEALTWVMTVFAFISTVAAVLSAVPVIRELFKK